MRRRAEHLPARAITEGRDGSASSVARQEHLSACPASEALLAFTEEFGLMIALQSLADPNRRRGYSLPEGIVGLAFKVTMLVLLYRLLAWVRR